MAANYMEGFDFSRLEHYQRGGAVLPNGDQYMGKLDVHDDLVEIFPDKRDTISYHAGGYNFKSGMNRPGENVVVILESPHRFEYDRSNNPAGLAMGKTGDNFFSYFPEALGKGRFHMASGKYNLIFTNAVQYQTSCGLNPIDRDLRDANWIDVYENHGGKDDFKWRLYALNPKYLFNLCTGGKNPQGLRQKVTDTLEEMEFVKSRDFAEGRHPSSWEYGGNSNNAIIY